jgi:methanogenic corrinoid protein MtbC1
MPTNNADKIGSDTLIRLRQALIAVDRISAKQIIKECLGKMDPIEFGDDVITPVMTGIGNDWDRGEVSLAEIYMAGLVAEEIISQLIKLDPRARAQPAIAIAVLEDHHMLGKRIVNAVVQASGWIIKDLGAQETSDLIRTIDAEEIDILMISTLMMRSALEVERVCDAIGRQGLPTRVVVGGAPFRLNPELWRNVGASAMGSNAASAIEIINRLGEKTPS